MGEELGFSRVDKNFTQKLGCAEEVPLLASFWVSREFYRRVAGLLGIVVFVAAGFEDVVPLLL